MVNNSAYLKFRMEPLVYHFNFGHLIIRGFFWRGELERFHPTSAMPQLQFFPPCTGDSTYLVPPLLLCSTRWCCDFEADLSWLLVLASKSQNKVVFILRTLRSGFGFAHVVQTYRKLVRGIWVKVSYLFFLALGFPWPLSAGQCFSSGGMFKKNAL